MKALCRSASSDLRFRDTAFMFLTWIGQFAAGGPLFSEPVKAVSRGFPFWILLFTSSRSYYLYSYYLL